MHHAPLQQQQALRLITSTLSVRSDPVGPVVATRPGPEPPAAVAAGDDEDVGTGIDSGAVSKGTSGTVTI